MVIKAEIQSERKELDIPINEYRDELLIYLGEEDEAAVGIEIIDDIVTVSIYDNVKDEGKISEVKLPNVTLTDIP